MLSPARNGNGRNVSVLGSLPEEERRWIDVAASGVSGQLHLEG